MGVAHTYYDTVEFKTDNVSDSAKSTLTAEFRVLAGNYNASEEKTVRYVLKNIHSITGGSATGSVVNFNVSGSQTLTVGPTVAATFYNVKTTDEDLSDTSFVRNVMVAEKEK